MAPGAAPSADRACASAADGDPAVARSTRLYTAARANLAFMSRVSRFPEHRPAFTPQPAAEPSAAGIAAGRVDVAGGARRSAKVEVDARQGDADAGAVVHWRWRRVVAAAIHHRRSAIIPAGPVLLVA